MQARTIFLTLLLIASLILEGVLTTMPLVLVGLIVTAVFTRNAAVFFLGFLLGILLDTMTMRVLGQTSVYFVLFLFLLFLYEKKFEIESFPFVLWSTFLGGLLYSLVFRNPFAFEQAIGSAILGGILYVICKKIGSLGIARRSRV